MNKWSKLCKFVSFRVDLLQSVVSMATLCSGCFWIYLLTYVFQSVSNCILEKGYIQNKFYFVRNEYINMQYFIRNSFQSKVGWLWTSLWYKNPTDFHYSVGTNFYFTRQSKVTSKLSVKNWLLMPIQPIYPENGPNGLNWQFCLAGT